MAPAFSSSFLHFLRDRITLEDSNATQVNSDGQPAPVDTSRIPSRGIPFSERGSRILVFRRGSTLYIRLAERWEKWAEEVGDYRHRPPVLQEFLFTDPAGAPLDFTLVTYPHGLLFNTRIGEFWLTFADEETLYVKLPNTRCGISFCASAAQGRIDNRGGVFKVNPEHPSPHGNIAYTTNARILSNTIEPQGDGYLCVRLQLDTESRAGLLLNITPRLGSSRSLANGEMLAAQAEARWHEWFAAAPGVKDEYAEQYYYAWWIMRAGLLSPRGYLTRESMVPSVTHYIGVWQWDALFHALAYRHVDRKLAEDQLRVLLDHQRDDGMLPDAVHDEGVVLRWPLPGGMGDADVTKPPLIAWAALKLYMTSGNRDFLAEVYEPITRWNRWWFEHNDDDGDGIVQYNHGFSSGLEDSPLWDEGMPVESPELNTYLVMQMDALAGIAGVLGRAEESANWRAQSQALSEKMITHFWDEEAGVFWATRDHQPIRVLTPFSLYPLLTGRLPRAMADRLVARLRSREEFWTAYPIPTVARSEVKFDPDRTWRGPTWANINYLFIEGLGRSGYADLAHELRERTLRLLMRHRDLYECYDPDTGEPSSRAASGFGWSSALFIDLAIQTSRGDAL